MKSDLSIRDLIYIFMYKTLNSLITNSIDAPNDMLSLMQLVIL